MSRTVLTTTPKEQRGRRFVGLDYTNTETRYCDACDYHLPISHFANSKSRHCFTCASAARSARIWTVEEMDTILRAARDVLDMWPRYLTTWTEADLVSWRALLDAVDRRNPNPERENEGDGQ